MSTGLLSHSKPSSKHFSYSLRYLLSHSSHFISKRPYLFMLLRLAVAFNLCLWTTSCGGKKRLKNDIRIDGSSTVLPITSAIAEEYGKVEPRVRILVGKSGTGGGFKKFLAKETDINNASRKIKSQEVNLAQARGFQYIELPVAYDGITIIIHPSNDWAQWITPMELKKIWESGSQVKLWSQIRKEWPQKAIKLFGPGTDSGTFDYFTKVINHKEHSSRKNYTMSEDDNVLVTGVAGNKYAMGYLGFAYYSENKDKLKALPVGKDKKSAIIPSMKNINSGSYKPLSREVFIYIHKNAAQRPEIKSFISFYLSQASNIVNEVGYVPLTQAEYKQALSNFSRFVAHQ